MLILRLILIASLVLVIYAACLVLANVESGWLAPVILFAVMFARRARSALTSYGTARWADASDMKGMLDE